MNSGTGTDPSTDRCPDCGHLLDRECGCRPVVRCRHCGRLITPYLQWWMSALP